MSTYRKEWDCCDSVTETDSWEPHECPFCAPHADSKRLAFLYDGTKTGSNALVDAELKLLNGQTLTLDEARSAIDEAMATPLAPPELASA